MGRNRTLNTTESAWRNFLIAHDRVLDRMDSDLVRECDMTIAEYEVLQHLYESPEHRLRMNELAELARLSPSGLTRRFDALVRRGWVARERCDEDRRGVLAQLTADGRDRFESARPVHVRGEQEYFTDLLGSEEIGMLSDTMSRLAAANDPDSLLVES